MKAIINIAPIDFTTPVVTLAMAKKNSNIQYDDQDDLLLLYLHAAVEDAENYTGTVVQQRAVTIKVDKFFENMELPVGPLTGSPVVAYKDKDGADQTLTIDDDYALVGGGYGLEIKVSPLPELFADSMYPITITGTFGYTAATVPAAIRSAILLKFADKELRREDSPNMGSDRSFYAALRPYRIW